MSASVAIMENGNLWIRRICYVSSWSFLASLIIAGCLTISPDERGWTELIRPPILDHEQMSHKTPVAFHPQPSFSEVAPESVACVASITDSLKQSYPTSIAVDLPVIKGNSIIENPASVSNAPVAWYTFDDNVQDSVGNAQGFGWYGDFYGLNDDFRIYDFAASSSQMNYVAPNGTSIVSLPLINKVKGPSETWKDEATKEEIFHLRYLNVERCINFLSKLNIGQVSSLPGTNSVLVKGSSEELRRVKLVLELVESMQDPVIENLGPASLVSTLPSNPQIEKALGFIKIGTFANPPQVGENARGIIDIQGSSIVAILPARYREQLLDLLATSAHEIKAVVSGGGQSEFSTDWKTVFAGPQDQVIDTSTLLPNVDDQNTSVPKTVRVALKAPEDKIYKVPAAATRLNSPMFKNGEDTIDLYFPETITLKQLLELAGEYLGLDYVYDPGVIGNQIVALKFQGSLEGQIKVKDLYILLETVLKSNGLAMTKRGEKLVTIVPIGQVLDADPAFIDETGQTVQTGDVVVTRIFEIKHVDVTSVANLLQHMKLGTVVSLSEETNFLFVTCYAHRMSRVEELVSMIDRPGRSKEFRLRRLQYTSAHTLADKLRVLTSEILGVPLENTSTPVGAPPQQNKGFLGPKDPVPGAGQRIYLEADERTNRVIMIGHEEQLEFIEELIDVLDVSREDLRIPMTYDIKHGDAQEALNKLQELEVLSQPNVSGDVPSIMAPSPSPKDVSTVEHDIAHREKLTEEAKVVVLEVTNQLLVRATKEQHAQIGEFLGYIDVEHKNVCNIPYKIYPLENSSPEHVADLLERLVHKTIKDKEGKVQEITGNEDQIIIVPDPNTFSLVVHATQKNQVWIETLIKSLDRRRPQVLIDVTLVEITRAETFEYDLNIVANAEEAVIENIGIEPIHRINSKSVLEGSFNLLDQEGNPAGQTKAFYSDKKVQALLTAIKRKNYGRVLAKPKILVDDGQIGEISTTDETTYLKESVQVPDQGSPLTTRDFQPIEAKIQLQITPHISEGDLLRLDVYLSRGDFGTRPTEGAPPDKTTSEVTTTVFVPDRHTVILGGLVKLNQSKGGSKIPILGDLPLVGGLFRSVDNSDVEKKLYVFLKANIIRPSEEAKIVDLQEISEEHQKAFEKSEAEFQKHENIPGITPKPMRPRRVLEER